MTEQSLLFHTVFRKLLMRQIFLCWKKESVLKRAITNIYMI